MVSAQRAVKRGVLGVFREEGWGTAAGSLFGILLLWQMLLLLGIGVQGGLDMLRQQTDLRLQIRPTATDSQIQDLIQNIRNLPSVEDVVYVTREQAYERQQKRDPQLVEFLTKFGIDNPFPDTLGVRLKRLDDFRAFADFLKQPVFAPVVDPSFLSETTDQERQVERLIGAVSAARTTLVFALGLAVIVLLFVVVEMLRRRVLMKRQELFVEQLVGAGRIDILLPFMVEMCVLIGIALIASLVVTGGVLIALPFFLPVLGAGGMFAPWASASAAVLWLWLPLILLGEIALTLLLSVLGTLIALKSQLVSEILPAASFH